MSTLSHTPTGVCQQADVPSSVVVKGSTLCNWFDELMGRCGGDILAFIQEAWEDLKPKYERAFQYMDLLVIELETKATGKRKRISIPRSLIEDWVELLEYVQATRMQNVRALELHKASLNGWLEAA